MILGVVFASPLLAGGKAQLLPDTWATDGFVCFFHIFCLSDSKLSGKHDLEIGGISGFHAFLQALMLLSMGSPLFSLA